MTRRPLLGSGVLALCVALPLLSSCNRSGSGPATPPVIAGVDLTELQPAIRGAVLRAELGCANCHGGSQELDTRSGADLTAIGSRVRTDWLRRFLADPLHVAPGTVMPDVLHDLDADTRRAGVDALAQFLLADTPAAATDPAPDPAAAERGRELFATIGCAACHAPRDERGAETPLPNSAPLWDLRIKYRFAGLRDFLLAPRDTRPSARMPDLRLQPGEAEDLAQYLLAGATAIVEEPLHTDSALVARGRELFVSRGCIACHRHESLREAHPPSAPALRSPLPVGGCLAETSARAPRYALSAAQRDALGATAELDAPQRLQALFASRQCLSCHARDGHGGPSAARRPLFRSRDEALGDRGRIPPALDGVGAKLQSEWLADAIAHGTDVRPYQRTRMPAFDDTLARTLTGLFTQLDSLPSHAPAPLPERDDQRRAVLDLGRALVGEKGMSCITCHEFAGERVGTMGSIDLVDTTARRLRPEWFRAFLLSPPSFQPDTLMPRFFIDGKSTRPELGDGDVDHQIDAIWHYLAQGRNVRKPDGMRQPPIELSVGTEAVVLRRAVQDTGKRGISVGLPGGVNFTFDAESLALNQIWWGRFLDASPVWTNQGSGQARILGEARASLGKGSALVALDDADAPWPAQSRRELGQRFLGYDLDAQRRPSFRYALDGVTVTDSAREEGAPTDARPRLHRVLRFDGTHAHTLVLRTALDKEITDLGDHSFRVGRSLQIAVQGGETRIAGNDDARELRVIVMPSTTEIVLDYSWQEAPK